MFIASLQNQEILAAGLVDFDLSLLFIFGLFVLFAILLNFIIVQPLLTAHQARYQSTGGARDDASSFELAAAEKQLQYDERLKVARQDAVQIREDLKSEGSAKALEIAKAMQEASDRRLAEHTAELTQVASRAREELKAQSQQLSDQLAAKLLGESA